jgi:hypothetical protein
VGKDLGGKSPAGSNRRVEAPGGVGSLGVEASGLASPLEKSLGLPSS